MAKTAAAPQIGSSSQVDHRDAGSLPVGNAPKQTRETQESSIDFLQTRGMKRIGNLFGGGWVYSGSQKSARSPHEAYEIFGNKFQGSAGANIQSRTNVGTPSAIARVQHEFSMDLEMNRKKASRGNPHDTCLGPTANRAGRRHEIHASTVGNERNTHETLTGRSVRNLNGVSTTTAGKQA